MPNTDAGRNKILTYLEENQIQMTSLAVKYDMNRTDVSNILHGKKTDPQAHRFIVRVIDDFKIR